jgi:hypothetical protein
VIVPPEADAGHDGVDSPPICSQISGPVVTLVRAGLAGLPNWLT